MFAKHHVQVGVALVQKVLHDLICKVALYTYRVTDHPQQQADSTSTSTTTPPPPTLTCETSFRASNGSAGKLSMSRGIASDLRMATLSSLHLKFVTDNIERTEA